MIDEALATRGAPRTRIHAALTEEYGAETVRLGNLHHHADYCLKRRR